MTKSNFSIYTPIAQWLNVINDGLSRPHDLPAGGGLIKKKEHRWKWLEDAVLQNIQAFHHEVADHRIIAPEDVFRLTSIYLRAEGECAANIKKFLNEFAGPQRIGWIKRIWPPSALNGLCLDGLRQVDQRENVSPPPSTTPVVEVVDPYEEALSAPVSIVGTEQQNNGIFLEFEGDWDLPALIHMPPMGVVEDIGGGQSTEPSSVTEGSVHTRLFIEDAKGGHSRELHEAENLLGGDGSVLVEGFYVSGKHLVLRWQGGRLLAEDISKNGTIMNGEPLIKSQPIPVPDKAEFLLGTQKKDDELPSDKVARVRISLMHAQQSSGGSDTPMRPYGEMAQAGTPVNSLPLLRLRLTDRERQWEEVVTRLPWVIGREGNTRIPEKNMAVSRKHLTIHELRDDGVLVQSQGTHGSYRDNQVQPEDFVLPYSGPLILGGTTLEEEHHPVQLIVLPGEHQAADQ